MSLINDALKQARKASQPNPPKPPSPPNPPGQPNLSPMQPVPERPRSSAWLLPAIVIFLLLAAIFLIGWALNQRNHPNVGPTLATSAKTPDSAPPATPATPAIVAPPAAPAPVTPVTTPPVAPAASNPVAQPAVAVPPPVKPSPPSPVVPVSPTNSVTGPKLQGIFYSVSAPSAIVDGKTVQVGDSVHQYRVKAITKNLVTLIGADKQELQLSMER